MFEWEEGVTYDMAVGKPMNPPPPSRLNPPREFVPSSKHTEMSIDVMVEDYDNGADDGKASAAAASAAAAAAAAAAAQAAGPRVIMAQPPDRVREAYKRASARAQHVLHAAPEREGGEEQAADTAQPKASTESSQPKASATDDSKAEPVLLL